MVLEDGQLGLALLYLRDGVKRVPDEIVRTWKTSADVAKWEFDNRTGAAGKPVELFCKYLKRRRQTIYKMMTGENKIDPDETDIWDSICGWSGFEQWLEMQKQKRKEAQAQAIQEIIKIGLQPTRRAA